MTRDATGWERRELPPEEHETQEKGRPPRTTTTGNPEQDERDSHHTQGETYDEDDPVRNEPRVPGAGDDEGSPGSPLKDVYRSGG
jgi:hypothetical protein